MIEKIKKYQNHPLVQDFRDIRSLGFAVFGILVLLVSWSGINVIETNYKLERQLAKLDQQNQVLQLQNNNQKLRNEYFNTPEYLELQARQQLGKGLPGEKLLLVPKSVALAHTVDLSKDTQARTATKKPEAPKYQQNLQAWRDFLFRRTLSPSS